MSCWRAATDLHALIRWLCFGPDACERKCRLFACAYCHHLARQLPDWPRAKYLPDVEHYVEGRIDGVALLERFDAIDAYMLGLPSCLLHALIRPGPLEEDAADGVFLHSCSGITDTEKSGSDRTFQGLFRALYILTQFEPSSLEPAQQVWPSLLHDIFGPLPFRDVTVDPAWLTPDVVALARGIYDDKAFDRMPILADALQDAGCDNDEVLNHCRREGWEHVRGCWVVDLLLGRPWRAG